MRPWHRFTLLLLIVAVALVAPRASFSWVRDQNRNNIDDLIESVESLGLAAAHEGGSLSGRLLISVHSEDAPLTYGVYVAYDHMPTDGDVNALNATGAVVTWRPKYIPYLRARASFAQVQALATQSGVMRVEALEMMYPFNDNASRTLRARDAQGGVGAGMFPAVWKALGITGRGVVVGIIDSGVNDQPINNYPGHESLRGKFVGGGDFSNEDASLNTPPDSSTNPRNAADPEGSYHGTHVAGTAVGSGGPEGQLKGAEPGTYAGIAPGAYFADLKALSDAGVGGGAPEALEWCIAHLNTYWNVPGADAVYHGVQVVNMSLGGLNNSDGTDASAAAVNAAVRAGITVCIATGNDGNTGYIASPASADLCISVGSFQDANTLPHGDDIVSDYSNEGPRLDDGDSDHADEMKPTVLGSGSDIVSAFGDPTTDGRRYHNINGTSMATPCVAGICALIMQANPNLTPLEVREILQNTSEHRTDHGKQPPAASDPFHIDPNYHPSWGWGLPDAYAAVLEALNSSTTQVVAEGTTSISLVGGALSIGLTWTTQREQNVTQFRIWRAPDVRGVPGDFASVSPAVAPVGRAVIERTANRTAYTWTDTDASLVSGATYWYQVRWTDTQGRSHTEPAFAVGTAVKPTLVRVNWSYAHNTPDNDLVVRYGSGTDINAPVFVRPTGGSTVADSTKQITPIGFGGPLTQYFFHQDLTEDDLVQYYTPPSTANPWFLSVLEKGYVNTNGVVEAFSVTVYNGSTGTTYTAPNPPTVTAEGTTTVFWIPADPATSLNHNPVLDPIGTRSGYEGIALGFQINARDADNQTLTYSATGLPLGATFTPATRTFSWTPAYGQAGTYTVTFRVMDTLGAADSERVTVMVAVRTPGSNTAPVLAPISDKTVRATTLLTFIVSATDAEGGPLTYSASPLPGSATFDAASRTFRWTPATGQDGVYGVTFRVADGGGAADSQAVLITVTPGVDQLPPPSECRPDTTYYSGTIGTGANGEMSDVKYHSFTVVPYTITVQGILSWLGGPAIDLDFYLLDADSNAVTASASLNDPEMITAHNLAAGTYYWQVVAFTNPNPSLAYSITSIRCVRTATGVGDGRSVMFALEQNAPNPFQHTSVIRFGLPADGAVRLLIYDASGRLVRTLVNGPMRAGLHQRVWDGTTDRGHVARGGVYFYRIETAQGERSRKMLFLR
jgi:hypothetical protein